MLKDTLKRLEASIKGPLFRISQHNALKENDFFVNFPLEGNVKIKLPKVSFQDLVLGKGICTQRNLYFLTRPRSEALLRKTIFEMYQTGYINPELSIVDIGSWISDNSIVWAKGLKGSGFVFAIDPSSENLAYGKTVASLNDVKNIHWTQAVCAERAGIKLDFDGTIDHASFKKSSSDSSIVSTTIDEIVNNQGADVGLLHVDVEGFELSVLKGAEETILKNMPVVSYEQHISKEDTEAVKSYLNSLKYRVFMINEVLPGCALDCRNFLAIPSNRALPQLVEFEQSKGRDLGIYSATIGGAIIEI